MFCGLLGPAQHTIAAQEAGTTTGGQQPSDTGAAGSSAAQRNPPGALTYDEPREGPGLSIVLDTQLDQLRRERESLTAVRSLPISTLPPETAPTSVKVEALQRQLHELLGELARRPRPEPEPVATTRKSEPSRSRAPSAKSKRDKAPSRQAHAIESRESRVLEASAAPVDSMALAQSLFRTGDYLGALKAFELAGQKTTSAQDRTAVKYFSAACLKKLGNTREAAILFREVANSKADDVLAESAQWQLSAQQWQEATKSRIAHLRELQSSQKPDSGSAPAVGSPAPPSPSTIDEGPQAE